MRRAESALTPGHRDPLPLDRIQVCVTVVPQLPKTAWTAEKFRLSPTFQIVVPHLPQDPDLPGVLAHEVCHAVRMGPQDPLDEVVCDQFAARAVRERYGPDSLELGLLNWSNTHEVTRGPWALGNDLVDAVGWEALARLPDHDGSWCVDLESWSWTLTAPEKAQVRAAIRTHGLLEEYTSAYDGWAERAWIEHCAAQHLAWAADTPAPDQPTGRR